MQCIDLEKSYVTMVLFDILVGQADRTPSNYGVIINNGQRTMRLSPLFDNATLAKPYITNEMMSLNGVLLSRKIMAEVVFSVFGESAVECCKSIIGKRKNILNDLEQCDFLRNKILEGLALFENVQLLCHAKETLVKDGIEGRKD